MKRHTCDGRVMHHSAIGLRQTCVGLGGGQYKVVKGGWQPTGGPRFYYGQTPPEKPISYAVAKQALLDGWVLDLWATNYVTLSELFPEDWDWTDPLPEGVTLDPGAEVPPFWTPGDEVPPGMNMPPLWPEGRPKWWELRWTESLLKEGGVLDVRNPLLLTEDCCVP